jgi:hypothetical protein
MKDASVYLKHIMKSQHQPIAKDLIAQHGLSEEEYKKIVEILGRKLLRTR